MKTNYLKTRKQELLSLKPNWDDKEAEPVSESAFKNLEEFLKNMPKLGQPVISPCPDGSIDAYWPPRKLPYQIAYMLINFTPEDGDSEYYVMFTDGHDKSGFLNNNQISLDL